MIQRIIYKFQDFLSEDFTQIAKFDTFEIPEGIQLYDPQEESVKDTDDFDDHIPDHDDIINKINVPDEFVPEEPYDNDMTQTVPNKLILPARSLIEEDIKRLAEEDVPQDPDGPSLDDPPQIDDQPSSDEDGDLTDKLAGRTLRRNRRKTVRFEPEEIKFRKTKRK